MISLSVFSQIDNSERNTDFKVNLVHPFLGGGEISIEQSISQKSGVGISLAFFNRDVNSGAHWVTSRMGFKEKFFAIQPYYRKYFGKKKTRGFLIELNSGIFIDDRALVGAGLAFGNKHVFKKGFIMEYYVGAGKTNESGFFEQGWYVRVGFNIGIR